MRPAAASPAIASLAAAVLVAGCGGAEQVRTLTGEVERDSPAERPGGTGEEGREGRPPPADASDERVIRSWNTALNAERYGLAADHFARPSVIEQVREVRLPDRRAAIAFNRSLPCKAKLTDVEAEAGSTVAAFELAPGPGGGQSCTGDARVRFVIEGGRIKEWRQLPGSRGPGGDVVRRPSPWSGWPGPGSLGVS
ncbi:MAG: hypothetical protein WD649_05040 [Thermoleophilaceae bacterium]